MIGFGMGLVWVGYTGVLWGVFLITGKNVGLAQLIGSTWPPNVPGAAGTGTGTGAATPATGAPGSGVVGNPAADVQASAGASQSTTKYFTVNGGT